MKHKKCLDCGKPILDRSTRCNHCRGLASRIPIEQRFWSKVNKNGPTMPHMDTSCWVWTMGYWRFGYGRFQLNWKKAVYAHRVSWELINGPIPVGLFVLHKCDNPPCINPAHLFLGTNTDNMRDMASKGRAGVKTGMDNPKTKLTPVQVNEIRSRYIPRKVSQRILAKEYGVTQTAIYYILTGKNHPANSP